MLFNWATQGDRERAEKTGVNMSTPAELLHAANHALRIEGNDDRAESLAAEIIESYPNSTEAQYAKELLREIFGVDGSAAGADEQQRRGPKLTPEQEANLQRHLRYQEGERTGEQGVVIRRTMQGVLLIPLVVGIAMLVAGLEIFASGGDLNRGVNIVHIIALPVIALGAAVSFYVLMGIVRLI
jgi:hypothetical protein